MERPETYNRPNLISNYEERQERKRQQAEREKFENWIELGSLVHIIIYPIDGGAGCTQDNAYFSKFGLSHIKEKVGDFPDRCLVFYSDANKQAKVRNRTDLAIFDNFNFYRDIQEILMKEPNKLNSVKIKYLDENDIDVNDLGSDVSKKITKLFKTDMNLRLGERDREARYRFNRATIERLRLNACESPPQSPSKPCPDTLNAYSHNFSSYSLVTVNQIEKLLKNCPKNNISYKNFRPNLVVGRQPGLEYSEEDIIQIQIESDIGDEVLFPIIRPLTHDKNVNQPYEATFPEEPYNTLMNTQSYSMKYPNQSYSPNVPTFGINMEMDPDSEDKKYLVYLGQKVFAKFKKGAFIKLGNQSCIVGEVPT